MLAFLYSVTGISEQVLHVSCDQTARKAVPSFQHVLQIMEKNSFDVHHNSSHQETSTSESCRDIMNNRLSLTPLPVIARLKSNVEKIDESPLQNEQDKGMNTFETKNITVKDKAGGPGALPDLGSVKTESGLCAVAWQHSVTEKKISTKSPVSEGSDDVSIVQTHGAGITGRNDSNMEKDVGPSEEVPVCLCSRDAVLKIVNSKGPNKGKRFWVCSNSRPFYVKKQKVNTASAEKSCKFFRWIDAPFVKSDEEKRKEKEKKRELNKQREMALLT